MADSEDKTNPAEPDLHERQVKAIEKVAILLSPEEIESRWRKLITKTVGLLALSAAVVAGGWELTIWTIDNWSERATINTWIEVAREIYEAEGNGEVASSFLQKVDEIDPQNVELVQLRAYIDGMSAMEVLLNLDRPWTTDELNQADMAKAQAILLQEVNPRSSDGLILRGQVTAALGDLDRALSFLEQALNIDPNNSFAKIRLSNIHRELATQTKDEAISKEHRDASKSRLVEALQLNPQSKLAYLWLGIHESECNNDAEAALECFNNALELDSRYHLALFNKGLVYLENGEFDNSIAAFNETLEVKPGFVKALEKLGWAHGEQDQYETAIQFTRRANQLDDGFMGGWSITGQLAYELYLQTGDVKFSNESIEAYSTALRNDPTNSDWYQLRSEIQLLLGNLTEAGSDARLAVRFGPEDAYAWLVLGNYRASIGNHEDATQSYRKSLEFDYYDDAAKGLARSLYLTGNTEDSRKQYDILVENSSEDLLSSNLVARGEFKEHLREYNSALEDYQNARIDDSENFDAWLGEARVSLELLSDAETYRTAIRNCRELRPEKEIPYHETDFNSRRNTNQ